jgi:hypothetical protein
MEYPFASCHEGPGFRSPRGYLFETGILLLALSRYNKSLSFHFKNLRSSTFQRLESRFTVNSLSGPVYPGLSAHREGRVIARDFNATTFPFPSATPNRFSAEPGPPQEVWSVGLMSLPSCNVNFLSNDMRSATFISIHVTL